MALDPIRELEQRAEEVATLQDATAVLETLLAEGFAVWEDGSLYYIRQLVDEVGGLKVHVYSREHAPPHFHVNGGGIDATFSILDCSLLKGQIQGRERRLIEWWHARSKPTLVETWNATRPSDCSVGPIE